MSLKLSFGQRFIIFILPLTLFMVGLFIHDVRAVVFYEDFSATPTQDGNILLEWWTDSEVNNQFFFIQRSPAAQGAYERLNSSYTLTESVNGEGGYYYFYEDDNVETNQTYYYRVEAVDVDGSSSFYGPINSIVLEGKTATPTLVATASAQPTTPLVTPTRAGSTATIAATFTRTVLIQATPAVTVTSRITDELGNTPDPNLTTTPTYTKTFEPLPTIELILPVSPTSAIQNKETPTSRVVTQPATAVPKDISNSLENLPDRLVVLIGVVGALWLTLGIFLVYMIRKLN